MKKIIACFLLIFLVGCAKDETHPKVDQYLGINDEIVEDYDGIYLADDGNIVSLYAYHGEEAFLENLSQVDSLAQKASVPVYLAVPPRKMDVLTDSLPEGFSTEPALHLYSFFEESRAEYIDILSAFSDTDGVYFSTDHHWTSKGAYLAYRKIVSAMGIEPLGEENFRKVDFCADYLGSDYNKKKEYSVADTITLWYTDNTDAFKTTIVNHPFDSGENDDCMTGLYDLDRLTSWDPYTVYLRGNNPYIRIEKEGESRDTLLVIRDSFASALAPLLAEHFDLVLIDPRFYPEPISAAVEREGASAILVLENMGSFTENVIKFRY